MPISYDPILLKKIARIYGEADNVYRLALKSGADLALREKAIEEEPRFLALMNEFDRDAVLAALRDVQQIRRETFEEVFGEGRRKPPPSGEGSPPSDR